MSKQALPKKPERIPPAKKPESKPPSKKNETKWIAKGRSYSNLTNGRQGDFANIEIPEAEPVINMPGGENIFGEPIDARLAVYYIRRLWTQIQREGVLTSHMQINKLLKSYETQMSNTAVTSAKATNKNDFLELSKKITEASAITVKWIVDLLENSFAITMDKNVLLKTLSQPECEGIRFYLCMKDKDGDVNNKDPKNGKLTLLTVGIDRDGKDLHFSKDSAIPKGMSLEEIPYIENASLCTEYPRTPGGVLSATVSNVDLVPYVLFRYAIGADNVEQSHLMNGNGKSR